MSDKGRATFVADMTGQEGWKRHTSIFKIEPPLFHNGDYHYVAVCDDGDGAEGQGPQTIILGVEKLDGWPPGCECILVDLPEQSQEKALNKLGYSIVVGSPEPHPSDKLLSHEPRIRPDLLED